MIKDKTADLIIGLMVFLGLYIISLNNYLLFHSIAEGFSIVIAFVIFIIAWNSRRFVNNGFFVFLGIAMLFVGSIDFLHVYTYEGMTIFAQKGSNLPTQLWIGARYLQSISILIAPLFLNKKIRPEFIFIFYSLITSLLLLSIFSWNIFPVCFDETAGLTPFKKISEYIISLILLCGIVHLSKHRDKFETNIFLWIIMSIIAAVASEIAFTYYISTYGFSNLVGHFLKIISVWFLYKAFVSTNLTEPYKHIFRDLKMSERRFRSLFNNMLNGFVWNKVLFDNTGKPVDFIILDVNKTFENITGLKRDTLVGKKITEIVPGIDKIPGGLIEKYTKTAVTGEVSRFEEYSKSLNRWYSMLIYSTEKGYFAVILEDITEKKQADLAIFEEQNRLEFGVRERTKELSKANELLNTIIDHMPAMLCLFDRNGRIKVLNNEFKDRTGWNIEDIGKTKIMKPGDSDTDNYNELGFFMKEAGPGWNDFIMKIHNQGVLETSWASAPLSDGSIIAIGIDITDRKKMHLELLNYMEQLKQSNSDLEEFAYIASHDLQEPLRKIRTFGDLLSSRLSDSIDETGRDYVERMQKASLRMQNLIDSLLTYSRISTSAKKLDIVNLNDSVASALSTLEIRIEEENAQIEVDKLPAIEGDIIQIVQLFQNLIGNALKFHKENVPPHIRIHAQHSKESVTQDSGSCVIYVEDNGIGFDENYLERIFSPFQRLHGKGVYEGVGMGLAICKKIISRHNGHITAKSSPGKGTTFIITVPCKQTKS